MRLGDGLVYLSMSLNLAAAAGYAWEGQWRNVGYWLAALQLNFWLTRMR